MVTYWSWRIQRQPEEQLGGRRALDHGKVFAISGKKEHAH
jgi:hypothetical protein